MQAAPHGTRLRSLMPTGGLETSLLPPVPTTLGSLPAALDGQSQDPACTPDFMPTSRWGPGKSSPCQHGSLVYKISRRAGFL